MPQYVKHPTISTLNVAIVPQSRDAFIDWQAKLNCHIAGFEGFVSLEFLSPSSDNKSWIIVERFDTPESANSWKNSQQYQELLVELNSIAIPSSIQEKTEGESNLHSCVTEVIITKVNPDMEKIFQEWSAKIHQLEAKSPGFRGVYLQSPKAGGGTHWITLLQFDNPENLDNWLKSSERQEVLKESNSFISSLETHRMVSPYAGWFSSIAKIGEIPSVWKQTMIVLLVLFPIVMMELKYLSPWIKGLDVSLGTFIGNALSVTLIAFPMMPLAIMLLGWWLSPSEKDRDRNTQLGTAVVVLLYVLEILIFWNFF